MSLRRVVHAQIVADLADYHLARVEPHADGELESSGSEYACVGAQLFQRGEGGVACSLPVVLVGDGSSEQRHHAVPGELVDGAFESVDVSGENLEDSIEDAMPVF